MNITLAVMVYDIPTQGKLIQGVLVHPLHAYMKEEEWLNHFERIFPEKAKKMREYSNKQGWPEQIHVQNWVVACLSWINDQVLEDQ